MELEGRILDGRYRLGSLLGVGGMARVYLATDRVLERQVAGQSLAELWAGQGRRWAGGWSLGPVQPGLCAVGAALWHPAVRVGSRQLRGGGRQPAPAPAARAALGAQPTGRPGVGHGGADRPGQGFCPALPARHRHAGRPRASAGRGCRGGRTGQPACGALPTEPLPGLPGRTGVLPAATGPAVPGCSRRPGWPR